MNGISVWDMHANPPLEIPLANWIRDYYADVVDISKGMLYNLG